MELRSLVAAGWPLSAFLLFALLGAFRDAEAASCPATDVDCKYFGCFPQGTTCPADCDTFLDTESCQAVKTADGRQACLFNPQYSMGKGLCQKAVTCFDLENQLCSDECFRCGYFGCLPNGTNCPARCEEFGSDGLCGNMGGVAGGMACQWNVTSDNCEAVPLALLTRTLTPPPLLAHPALLIRNGVTITPSAFPVAAPTAAVTPPVDNGPVTWAGASGRPNRLALYVGLLIAALGLICAAALVYHQRSKKRELNKALSSGAPVASGRPTLSSSMAVAPPPGDESKPRTQFRRGSLIVHIRNALGETVQKESSSPGERQDSPASGTPVVGVPEAAKRGRHPLSAGGTSVELPFARGIDIRQEAVESLGSGHCLSPALKSPAGSSDLPMRRMSAPPSPLPRLSSEGDLALGSVEPSHETSDPSDDRPAAGTAEDEIASRHTQASVEDEAAWRNAVLSRL